MSTTFRVTPKPDPGPPGERITIRPPAPIPHAVAPPPTLAVPPGWRWANALAPESLVWDPLALHIGPRWGVVLMAVAYPPAVDAGWLQTAAQLPGVTVSVHAVPQTALDLITALNRRLGQIQGSLAAGKLTPTVQQRLVAEADGLQRLLRQVDLEQQAVVQVGLYGLVQATDADEGRRRQKRLEGVCAAQGIRLRVLAYRQEDGLRAVGPWGLWPAVLQPQDLWPVRSLASSWPFGGGGVNHGHGIVLGQDAAGGLVLLDRWDPPADAGLTNKNWTVLAGSGAGKSHATKVVAIREWAQGATVIILDPEREYRALAAAIGGQWINAGGGGTRLNPLQPPPMPDVDLDDAAAGPGSVVMQHLQRVHLVLDLYLPHLSPTQRARLGQALRQVYDAAGLLALTDPSTVAADAWPHLGTLYEALRAADDPISQELANLLEEAAVGSEAPLWAGPSTIPTAPGDFIVLDLHDLERAPLAVQQAQYSNLLGYAWDLVRRDRTARTLLIVDEAWMLVNPQVPQALSFLKSMSKRIRKYAGSLMVISQNPVDFLAPEVARDGEPVLANASTKLLMRQEAKDLPTVARLFGLSDAEQDRLASARVGEGLLLAGNQRAWLAIATAPHEAALIYGGEGS